MWIHVLGEQTQPSAHEQLLNIKTLPLAQEVPELHIAGAGPQYIQFKKAKLDIFLFSQALLEMCYETVKEAACKAGQSFSPTQAAHAQVPHRDTAPEGVFTSVPSMGCCALQRHPAPEGNPLAAHICMFKLHLPH